MGKKDFVKLCVFLRTMLAVLLVAAATALSSHVLAADLPLATVSPLTGVPFDDRPLSLPVQRNFQMAMLTASSELGRSCGPMEAYGWRMSQTEQNRVNQIFNTTVDHLRSMNYTVEAQTPTSVSRDITMFTADRVDHHFIFMWSAGELGLVMVLCEGSKPMHYHNATASTSSVEVFPPGQDILQSTLDTPPNEKVRRTSIANFSPIGDWVGGYTCAQGYTGGTLQITLLEGENFQGIFRFYPTPKNPYVPAGRYTVYGQYDKASQRILINPGKWLERPKNFYNTIMVGNFDPVQHNFSAYFQGISGCTSFEAHAATEDYENVSSQTKKAIKKRHKKKVVKKKQAVETVPMGSPAITPAGSDAIAPAAAPTPTVSTVPSLPVPSSPAPASPSPSSPTPSSPTSEPPPDAAPSSIVLPAPSPTPAPAPTPAPTPAVPVSPAATQAPISITPPTVAPPASPAPVAPQGTTAPTPDQAPKPSGSLEPRHSPKLIQLAASGDWVTPYVQPAPQAIYLNPTPPQVQPAQIVAPAQIAPQANILAPQAPEVPPPQIVPQPVLYNENPAPVTAAQTVPPAQIAPDAIRFTPSTPPVPPAEIVPDHGGPHP